LSFPGLCENLLKAPYRRGERGLAGILATFIIVAQMLFGVLLDGVLLTLAFELAGDAVGNGGLGKGKTGHGDLAVTMLGNSSLRIS
jgi:hypothetical protein